MKVYPNPWCMIAPDGLPCGVLPKEPTHDSDNPREFVGAKLDRKRTKITDKAKPGDLRYSRQSNRWSFCGVPDDQITPQAIIDAGPIEVPDTPYYFRAMIRGELFIADEAGRAKMFRRAKPYCKAPAPSEPKPAAAKAAIDEGTP